MKKTGIVFFGAFLLAFIVLPGQAAVISLKEWTYSIDGVVSDSFEGDSSPVIGDLAGGLGMLTWTTSTTGIHNFIAFYDYEIDQEINGFSNETGVTHGSLLQGQSWEMDEPGYMFGDIFDNTLAGTLDNTNSLLGMREDASIALGWNFTIDEGQSALITLLITEYAPASGFYLQQFDPDSNASIYLSSSLDITAPVPEPSSLLLLGAGMIALASLPPRRGNLSSKGQ